MSRQKPPPGCFTLLYFAAASSYVDKSFEHLQAPLAATELFVELEKKHPGIKDKILDSCALTVNLDYVDLEDELAKSPEVRLVIKEGDEVAIIPPVSSG
jgi:molybdopterin synthase sulfur carrier subunit